MQEALKRDNAFLESAKVTMNASIVAQETRVAMAGEATTSAMKKRSLLLVEDTIHSIVDLALVCADYRSYAKHYEYNITDEDPAPFEVWSDMKRAYVNVQELPGFTTPSGNERVWGETITNGSAEVGDVTDAAEYKEYISGEGMWDKFTYKKASVEADEAAKFALGDAIIDASLVAEPFPVDPEPPVIPDFPLKVVLTGPSFAGQVEQSERLAERYNCAVISVAEELQKAVELSEKVQLGTMEEPAEGIVLDACLCGREANSKMVLGGEVPDEIYVKLVVTAIKALAEENAAIKERGEEEEEEEFMGWVLQDFPQTKRQAILLEKSLSGYDFEAHIWNRHDRASSLAEPKPLDEVAEEVKKSAIDLVINLGTELGSSLSRSLGRRIDPETGEQYHLDNKRPPYDLICKERLIEPHEPSNAAPNLSLQVLTHEKGMSGAGEFYDKFGGLYKVVETSKLTPDGTFASINKYVEEMLKVKGEEEMKKRKEKEGEKAAEVEAEGGGRLRRRRRRRRRSLRAMRALRVRPRRRSRRRRKRRWN